MKKLSLFLMAGLLAVSLTACGAKDEESRNTESTAVTESVGADGTQEETEPSAEEPKQTEAAIDAIEKLLK